jgi:hypothetical protein
MVKRVLFQGMKEWPFEKVRMISFVCVHFDQQSI